MNKITTMLALLSKVPARISNKVATLQKMHDKLEMAKEAHTTEPNAETQETVDLLQQDFTDYESAVAELIQEVIDAAPAPPANTPPANTPPANTPPANTPPANTPPALDPKKKKSGLGVFVGFLGVVGLAVLGINAYNKGK